MRIKKEKQIYALYKGETFIDVGTIPEISKRQQMSNRFLHTIKTPDYMKRGKDNSNRLLLIKLDDEE